MGDAALVPGLRKPAVNGAIVLSKTSLSMWGVRGCALLLERDLSLGGRCRALGVCGATWGVVGVGAAGVGVGGETR